MKKKITDKEKFHLALAIGGLIVVAALAIFFSMIDY